MVAIVMNLLTGAVSEYGWTFKSISAEHAADASGLYAFGGDTDGDAYITAEARTGRTAWGSGRKKTVEDVYFGLQGAGLGVCRIEGPGGEWEYTFPVRASGMSRAVPGKGIAENYLSFGYRNVAGAGFILDRIETGTVQSKQRSL
jgi:hypothetical protein